MKWGRPKILENSRDIFPHVAYFGLPADEPIVSPHRGHLLYPAKRSLFFEKSPRGRHPIWSKKDNPHCFVPLEFVPRVLLFRRVRHGEGVVKH